MIYSLIVFLPLIAFLLAGLFGRWIGDRGAQVVTCVAVSVAALLAWIGFYSVIWGDGPTKVMLFTWITSGDFDVAGVGGYKEWPGSRHCLGFELQHCLRRSDPYRVATETRLQNIG